VLGEFDDGAKEDGRVLSKASGVTDGLLFMVIARRDSSDRTAAFREEEGTVMVVAVLWAIPPGRRGGGAGGRDRNVERERSKRCSRRSAGDPQQPGRNCD